MHSKFQCQSPVAWLRLRVSCLAMCGPTWCQLLSRWGCWIWSAFQMPMETLWRCITCWWVKPRTSKGERNRGTRLLLQNMFSFSWVLKIRQLAPFPSIDYPEVLYAYDTLTFGIDRYAIDWIEYLQARVCKVLLSININNQVSFWKGWCSAKIRLNTQVQHEQRQ